MKTRCGCTTWTRAQPRRDGFIGIEFCPLHAVAEQMRDALNEIALDATELAAMEGIEKSERRAWQAIANKARKAIGEK